MYQSTERKYAKNVFNLCIFLVNVHAKIAEKVSASEIQRFHILF